MSAGDGPPSGPVVCVGAHVQGLFMHVERVPREGESVRAWGYREPFDGGKVANVAVAAARLGAPVRLVTVIGTDERSARWLRDLAAEGIGTESIAQVEGPMDVGPALLPPSKIPALATVGDLAARIDAAFVAERAETLADAAVVVCALESPTSGVEEALRRGRLAGATTILNPSPVATLPASMLEVVDVLVANEDEAASLSEPGLGPADAARTIAAARAIPTVIVTAGADGAFVADARSNEVRHAAAPPIERVVDTTGAGDAFTGALSAELRRGASLSGAVELAVAAASLACTREHTMASYAGRDELDAFVRGRTR